MYTWGLTIARADDPTRIGTPSSLIHRTVRVLEDGVDKLAAGARPKMGVTPQSSPARWSATSPTCGHAWP
ncbi:hypothetical protein [Nocardia neocaledoniensis]|uniref:hypothetical protein n=1 Tax=Nocardia neocaledoniensis TaxID=236511 RepID=UPI000D713E6C|nr:hypothetical protein [Nocardia neocaledoniensis]